MNSVIKTRSPQLSPLSEEHRAGLLFTDRVRKGLDNVPMERVRNYVRWYWKNHIRPHFWQEEKVLLPYFPANHELVAKLKDDHDYIRDLILELDHDGDAATLRCLCSLLVEHIRFEEQQLFTWLEDNLSPEQLDDINKELLAHPVACIEWPDSFWQ